MEIDQAEWEKRIGICQRKLDNFISRMTIDFGIYPIPIVELPTVEGVLHIPGIHKFVQASDEDLAVAVKTIDEANKRYKERKARKENKGVSDIIGEPKSSDTGDK